MSPHTTRRRKSSKISVSGTFLAAVAILSLAAFALADEEAEERDLTEEEQWEKAKKQLEGKV